MKTLPGNSTVKYNGLSSGDLLFYDWGDGRGRMHASILTTPGEDPNYQGGRVTGDLVDEHTSDRKRVWWTLSPYNINRNLTTLYLMPISSGN